MATELATLANRINAGHKRFISQANKTLSHAKDLGKLFCEAKEKIQHGELTQWIEENCQCVGVRQARNYMRVYQNWPLLEAKTEETSVLTIDGALKALAKEKAKSEGNGEREKADVLDDARSKIIKKMLSTIDGLVNQIEELRMGGVFESKSCGDLIRHLSQLRSIICEIQQEE